MRSPVVHLAHNLRWTRHGTVWADWLLDGLPYGFRPTTDKYEVRGLHQALLRALPGESLLLGVATTVDAVSVVERMIDGIDLAAHPDWAIECEATFDTLDRLAPGGRLFWLSVPLGHSSTWSWLAEAGQAAMTNLRDALAVPRPRPAPGEVARRLRQAGQIAAALPAPFQPRPATPAQMLWLHQHAQQRGLGLDEPLPGADPEGLAWVSGRGVAALPDAVLDEGGRSDRGPRQVANPLRHRYLKVTQPDLPGDTTTDSYQALLALADVPTGGMLFPGSEFIGRLDETGLDIDWAMRLHIRSSTEVQAKNRRALVNLNEQFHQRHGEVSLGLGVLDQAAADLTDYARVLDSDKLEVETQMTLVLAVAGPTADAARDQARQLADYLGAAGFRLTQPLGGQAELWWAMQPGAPTGRLVHDLYQISTSRSLSAAVPLASTDLGDRVGSLLALNTTSGRPSVVLHDISGASSRDISGSVGVVGELGAGKALDVDTPIPTPSGWTRMGDLAVGDQVFDEAGQPTRVLATSPVMTARGCVEVVFSDGATIVADRQHLWSTLPRATRQRQAKANYTRAARGEALVDLAETARLTGPGWFQHATAVTSQQIGDSVMARGQINHAIPVTAALELAERDLLIAPYLLGAWLGGGDSGDVRITSADPQILTLIEMDGYEVVTDAGLSGYRIRLPHEPQDVWQPRERACEWCGQPVWARYEQRRYCTTRCACAARRAGAPVLPPRHCPACRRRMLTTSTGRWCAQCRTGATLRGRLRELGVLGDKHIPADYLRASIAQRRALLAGLLDTDGTVSDGGSVEVANSSQRLIRDVHELVCSLGYRPALRSKQARCYGQDCGRAWTVSFATDPGDQVFRLTRKNEVRTVRAATASRARYGYRYIVDVRPVPTVPVRCIQVASTSGLFLAGRAMVPTHNSTLLKAAAGAVVDRGGRIVVPDRTAMGEYATWATSITDAQVVDVTTPTVSLDPLRLFPGPVGAAVAQSFLTPLLNVSPTSTQGVLLSEVLDPDYLAEHGIASLGCLPTHLARCDLPGASELGRLINVFARKNVGRPVFDPDLPVLNVDSPAVIIRTHGLGLPTHAELANQHLFAQLPVEKLLGRALYALIAALARQWCFADLSQLGAFVVDEAHHVTGSPEGEKELIEFVRDGRKHRAAVLLGSHDPEADFGSPTLRGLIPTRVLMRHRDVTLARRGLAWLDLDPDDAELVEMVTEQLSPLGAHGEVPHGRRGEALLRHPTGVGRIQVLEPSRPDRAAAARTSPPEQTRQ